MVNSVRCRIDGAVVELSKQIVKSKCGQDASRS
jgi:hypothetical protein